MRLGSVLLSSAIAFSLVSPSLGAAAECDAVISSAKINGVFPWKAGDAVGFQKGLLNVDADGAPDSYRVDGSGLSYTCDGISAIVEGVPQTPDNNPRHWQKLCRDEWARARKLNDYSRVRVFGFLTGPGNKPIVQGEGDPLPGQAFITTTSMTVPGTPERTQRHYVDANEIPYVVLSQTFASRYGVGYGDVAVVYWPAREKFAFATFADGGKLGEASVRLHQDIGNDPIIIKGGTRRAKRGIEGKIVTLVFPGKVASPSTDNSTWLSNIVTIAKTEFENWGGIDRLKACTH